MSFLKLLTPWGLLGLLGIAILILIYILKPNYQQKIISSTHIWKLSLKYRKKRIPINRFRNILIFICQLLILTCCAFLLAQPFLAEQKPQEFTEKVFIVDASASMRVENAGGITRFERAVSQVKEAVRETLSQNGTVSVILADDDADFLMSDTGTEFTVRRAGADSLDEVNAALDALVEANNLKCSYGSADMDGAVEKAELILNESPKTEVLLYTATEYIEKGDISVVSVAEAGEWNAAILGVTASFDDLNYYQFEIDAACFGDESQELVVHCDVYGVNGSEDAVVSMTEEVLFSNLEQRQTISFSSYGQLGSDMGVYSYDYVHVYVEANDSFAEDNTFYLYGGKKPTLRILYSSSLPNSFFSVFFLSLRESMSDIWNIEFDEKKVQREEDFITSRYDLYIFEHAMPEILPTDGVVFLADPDIAPEGSDFTLARDKIDVDSAETLASGEVHPLTNGINANDITIARYGRILYADGYQELMYYQGDPVLLVKEDELQKFVVLAVDLNRSNLPMLDDFLYLLYNTVDYFLPATISSYIFEIGNTVEINARSPFLTLSTPEETYEFESFPLDLVVMKPGMYTLSQETMLGELVVEHFFVHIPNVESDITKSVDSLPLLYYPEEPQNDDLDLLFYIAIGLVALLFVEWWLQSREYF